MTSRFHSSIDWSWSALSAFTSRVMPLRLWVLIILFCQQGNSTARAQATFMGLGTFGGFESRATDVSADGSVVVGFSEPNLFRWTRDESLVRPAVQQGRPSLSADGSVVVGIVLSPDSFEAFRWTIGGNFTPLGDLPGGVSSPVSRAFDVSADGRTVVGHGTVATGEMAFRWTPETGMIGLGDLAGGDLASRAHGISANGAVIVGYATGPDNRRQAARWTTQGDFLALPRVSGEYSSQANAVSADGEVMVGFAEYGPSQGTITYSEAFRWSAGAGRISLGDLPGGGRFSIAHDVSADGSVIVGASDTIRDDGNDSRAAFYWTRDLGMVNLQDFLSSAGAQNLDGWRLSEARAVSHDGLTIVGTGLHDGRIEAWVATIPEPSTLVLAAIVAAAAVILSIAKSRRALAW